MNSKKWDIPVHVEIENEIYSIDHVLKNTAYPELVEAVLEQMRFNDSEDYYKLKIIGRSGATAIRVFNYSKEIREFCKKNQSIISNYILEWCRDTGSIDMDNVEDALMEIETYTFYDDVDEDERNEALDNINTEVLAMCYGFKKWSPYWKNRDLDTEELWDMYRFLGEDIYDEDMSSQVFTFLAWFCLEGVAFEFQKQD